MSKTNNAFYIFLRNFSIVAIVLATVSFFLGFHEVDLGFNMGRKAIDIGLDGESRTATEVYQAGIKKMMLAYILFIASFFMILAVK